MRYKNKTREHKHQCGGCQREGDGDVGGKGDLIYGDRDDLTLDGGHTMQYTDLVT